MSDFFSLTAFKETPTSITLKRDTIEVTIKQSKFDRKKHKFKYLKDYPEIIELVDGKKYWGRDGGMPTRQFEGISIKVGQRLITLPKYAFEGLYEPNIYTAEVNCDKANDTFYIHSLNSDGAGSYYVIFKVEKGVYKARLVAYGF